MSQVVQNQSAPILLPEERLLVLAARIRLDDEDAAEMERIAGRGLDWNKVMEYSLALGVQPLLYKHLCRERFASHVPHEVLLQLKESYCTQSIRSLRIYSQINRIINAFGSPGIPIVLLKGAFLAKWVYEDIALRPMSDIDILCRKCDEQLIQSTLLGLGYYQERSVFHSPFHETVQNVGCHHLLPFRKADAHTVEVHTHLSPDDCGPTLEMDKVWETVTDCKLDGLELRCLALDDQLLYLCFHLYRHIASQNTTLYWFCDIHEMINRYMDRIDWSRLDARAHSLGVADQVGAVLRLLKTHWNTPIPERILPGAYAFTPKLCLATILDHRLYDKQNEIERLTDYAQELRFVFHVKGWANRFHYLWRLIFPTRAHLMHRYKIENPIVVFLCYFMLPFIRFKHLLTGLFHKALFQFKRNDRGGPDFSSRSDAKATGSMHLHLVENPKSKHNDDRS